MRTKKKEFGGNTPNSISISQLWLTILLKGEKTIKNLIKKLAAASMFFVLAGGVALADHRTDLVVTAPVSSNVSASHVGVGFSYDLANAKYLTFGPQVVVTNFGTNPRIQPGLGAGIKLGKFTLGLGELLKPGSSINLDQSHYNTVVTLGVRL